MREHIEITDRQLNAPLYYSRWFYCSYADCRTTTIMPDEYRVYREQRVEWTEQGERMCIDGKSMPKDRDLFAAAQRARRGE